MAVTGGRPRIALVASSFHPYAGGVEQHVRQVARELQRTGHEVVVWTVDRGEHLGRQEVDGVRVRHLPTPLPARDAGAIARFVVAAPRVTWAWAHAWREFRPDVLHVHCFGPNGIYALALHRLTGCPLVLTSHGETFADDHGAFDQSALLRASLRRAVSRASAVTAPSEFVLDDLRRRFGLKGGEVVPNGVHLDPLLGPAPTLPSGPMVFSVGRVERMKGFDLLLDAVAKVDIPDLQVVIGGDGAALGELRDRARELGLARTVHCLGRLSPSEVAGAMRVADVVVVPSRQEAFGIVALEAWRSGTPLIGTSHGGMAEFVTDGADGRIVDPLDAVQLAGAIEQVLGDRVTAERFVAAGHQRVRSFTWTRVSELYERLFARVLGPTGQGGDS